MGSKSIGAAVLSLAATSAAFAASSSEADLKLLVYQSKLINPTGAVFLDSHNALVTQKNDGKVLLLKDGKTIGTALDLKVANKGSQGLLDIALSPKFSKNGLIYLFMTPSDKDGGLSTSGVVNSYRFSPGLGKLVFRETLLKVSKSTNATDVSGVITFNSQNKPKIIDKAQTGALVVNTAAITNLGTIGTVKLVHAGLPNYGSSVIGLVPRSTMQQFAGGTLTLTNTNATIQFAGSGVIKSGQTVLNPVSGSLVVKVPPAVSAGTFTLIDYSGTVISDLLSKIQLGNYAGVTLVNGGTLALNNPANVGTLVSSGQNVSTTVGSGTLIINPSSTGSGGVIISNGLTSGSTAGGTFKLGTSYGSILLSGSGKVTSGQLTLQPIPGLGNVGTLIGSGQLILTGSSSYTGQTIVGSGTLSISPINTGTLVLTGGQMTSDGKLTFGTQTFPGAYSVINTGTLTSGTGATGSLSGGTLSIGTIITQSPAPTSDGQITLVDPGSSPTDLGVSGTISLGSGTIDVTTAPNPVADVATTPSDPPPAVADPTVVPAALSLTAVQTPEPGIVALLSSVGAGILLRRRRRL